MLVILLLASIARATTTATLDPKELRVERKSLFVPSLQEIASVLGSNMKNNYAEVEVDVVECPDLREPPFMLAGAGLNGSPRLVDVGGVQYTEHPADFNKIYDLTDIPSLVDLESSFIIGATPGSEKILGVNTETAVNIEVHENNVNQLTTICKTGENDVNYMQETLSKNETRYSFLGDFFVSEGKPGQILRIHAKRRIGKDNFAVSIIKALKNRYKDKILAFGGTFLLQEGWAKVHLMPHTVPPTGLPTRQAVFEWFRYFNISAPLTAVGTLTTGSYDLDLRDHHFHFFSRHGDCGHYHIDTSPETAEYLGYFNVAEYVYRIDRPNETGNYL